MPLSRGVVVLLAVLWTAGPVLAQPLQGKVEQIVESAKLGRATLGLAIVDLSSGQELAEIEADRPLIPASNMKLITTAAALSALGPRHMFTTQLSVDGRTLIVRGTGDPAFGDPVILEELGLDVDHVLRQWVEAVRRTGLTHFDAILVDDRIFDHQFVHPNWPTNQLHHWYCAQVAGINFNDNCIDFYAAPTTAGRPPSVRIVPAGAPVTFDNRAQTAAQDRLGVARRIGTNQIVVTGQIKTAMRNPSYVTIDDPPLTFGGLLRNRLGEAGVRVEQVRRAAMQEMLPRGRLLAEVQTTLPTVLIRTNRDSQNLFAEALLKHLGHKLTGEPGGWENGAAALQTFLAGTIGPASAETVAVDDGSGLSRHNRVSPRVFVQVLDYMHRDGQLGPIYRDSLAQPGERGTLRRRLTNDAIGGQIFAKSGYINGVVTFGGYVYRDGRTFAFSILVNNHPGGTHPVRTMMDRIVMEIDRYAARQSPELLATEPANLGG